MNLLRKFSLTFLILLFFSTFFLLKPEKAHALVGPPYYITATPALSGSHAKITFTWHIYAGANSYRIQYGTDNIHWLLIDGIYPNTSTTQTYVLDGISTGTRYYYRMASVSFLGQSDWSTSASVITPTTTGGGNIATPTNLKADKSACAGNTSVISFTWNAVSGASFYVINIDGTTQNVSGPSLSKAAVSGHTYHWTVNACSSSNCSSAASGPSVTANTCTATCTPTNSCSSLSYQCGSFTNSCGATVQCGSNGSCTDSSKTCSNHKCVNNAANHTITVGYVAIDKNNNLELDDGSPLNEYCIPYPYTITVLNQSVGKTLASPGSSNCSDRSNISTIPFSSTQPVNVKLNFPSGTIYHIEGLQYIDANHSSPTKIRDDNINVSPIGNAIIYFYLSSDNNTPPPAGGGGNKCDSATLSQTSRNGKIYNLLLKTNCAKGTKFTLKMPTNTNGWKYDFSGSAVSQGVLTVGNQGDANFKTTVTLPQNPGTGATYVLTADGPGSTDATLPLVYNISPPPGGTGKCSEIPDLTTKDPSKNAKKGQAVTFSVTLKDNNPKCNGADYEITHQGEPAGWSVKINTKDKVTLQNVITTRIFTVKITSPSTAQKGDTANVTITAKNTASNASKTLALAYTVGGSGTGGGQCTVNPDSCPQGQTCDPSTLTCQASGGGECTVDPNSCPSGQVCNSDTLTCETAPGGACTIDPDSCPSGQVCNPDTRECETPSGSSATYNFTIGLHDIGKTGDSVSSTFATNNLTPANATRTLTVSFYDPAHAGASDDAVDSFDTDVTYDATSGKFKGSIAMDGSLADGAYIMKVSAPGYLVKKVGDVTVGGTGAQNFSADLVTGDINGDNVLNIDDYSILLSCSVFAKTDADSTLCNSDDSYLQLSNLNDDLDSGDPLVDQLDYNYFIREFLHNPNGD